MLRCSRSNKMVWMIPKQMLKKRPKITGPQTIWCGSCETNNLNTDDLVQSESVNTLLIQRSDHRHRLRASVLNTQANCVSTDEKQTWRAGHLDDGEPISALENRDKKEKCIYISWMRMGLLTTQGAANSLVKNLHPRFVQRWIPRVTQ